MSKIEVKKRKKIDQNVLAVFWNSEGDLSSGYADIFDDGTALIECKDGGHTSRQAGSWLRFLDYKIISGTVIQIAAKIVKEKYVKK